MTATLHLDIRLSPRLESYGTQAMHYLVSRLAQLSIRPSDLDPIVESRHRVSLQGKPAEIALIVNRNEATAFAALGSELPTPVDAIDDRALMWGVPYMHAHGRRGR